MADLKELYIECYDDPAYEGEFVSDRPLRGLQPEIIKKVENFLESGDGGVMPILSARQTGKNEVSAILQRRHLLRNQKSKNKMSWIRTAPTHEPQIVVSKK